MPCRVLRKNGKSVSVCVCPCGGTGKSGRAENTRYYRTGALRLYVDVYGKTADVQLSFDAYRGDETSAGKLNYVELTVPCTPNGDGFSYMRTCYDKLEKALGEPFTTDVNMDGVSAEDDTDTLFAALQKDAGGENVCALQYQWRGLGENESLLYLYYYPNENGSARVKLTFLPKERAQIP